MTDITDFCDLWETRFAYARYTEIYQRTWQINIGKYRNKYFYKFLVYYLLFRDFPICKFWITGLSKFYIKKKTFKKSCDIEMVYLVTHKWIKIASVCTFIWFHILQHSEFLSRQLLFRVWSHPSAFGGSLNVRKNIFK